MRWCRSGQLDRLFRRYLETAPRDERQRWADVFLEESLRRRRFWVLMLEGVYRAEVGKPVSAIKKFAEMPPLEGVDWED